MPYFLARERGGKSPALRPSHPQVCRKRVFRQGQALWGRFAGLDVHALASGLIHLRATDEEASGGGSVKGSSQAGSTKTTTQKSVSRLSQFSRIPIRDGHDTCQSVSAYAPQSFPDTYGVASHTAFRCPRRHALYADLALRQIQTARLTHSVQAFAAYRLLIYRMRARRCRHAHGRYAGYTPAIFPMPTSCVPVSVQMSVYSSGLVSEGQPTFHLYAARIASRLSRGAPLRTPKRPKAGKMVKHFQHVHTVAIWVVRAYVDNLYIFHFTVGLYDMIMSDYIR